MKRIYKLYRDTYLHQIFMAVPFRDTEFLRGKTDISRDSRVAKNRSKVYLAQKDREALLSEVKNFPIEVEVSDKPENVTWISGLSRFQ